jgi:transcriptional regulator with XRE-family HTH domain
MPSSHKSLPNPRKASIKAGRRASLKAKIVKLEKKVGQKALARMLGVSPRSIRRYKKGTRYPNYAIRYKIGRAGKVSKGLRRTKSIKRKKARAEKLVSEHPEIIYFESRKSFEFAETQHIVLRDVKVEDVPKLVEYLIEEGADAACFIIKGIDTKTKEERYLSSEIMEIGDFSEDWEGVLSELMQRYDVRVQSVDLIGIKYNAPSLEAR